jgi:hypothetical protein
MSFWNIPPRVILGGFSILPWTFKSTTHPELIHYFAVLGWNPGPHRGKCCPTELHPQTCNCFCLWCDQWGHSLLYVGSYGPSRIPPFWKGCPLPLLYGALFWEMRGAHNTWSISGPLFSCLLVYLWAIPCCSFKVKLGI